MKRDELLENAIEAINKWKEKKLAQGKKPVCISHFLCIDPKNPEKSPKTTYAIFGESDDVMGLLAYTNTLLNPKGGKDSLVEKNSSRVLFAHQIPKRKGNKVSTKFNMEGSKFRTEVFTEESGVIPRRQSTTKKRKK